MKTITYEITLKLTGNYSGYTTVFPVIQPRKRTGQLDQRQAVKQLREAFATMDGDFADMVREVREGQIRVRQSRR